MNRHISKKPAAPRHAQAAADMLSDAIELLGKAETELTSSGWHRASVGVYQAKLRIESWRSKVFAELHAVKGGAK